MQQREREREREREAGALDINLETLLTIVKVGIFYDRCSDNYAM